MTDLAQQEQMTTALAAVQRSDFETDPRGFIRAQNALFDAVCGVAGYAATSQMSDEEIVERAAMYTADFLTNGDR